MPTLGTRLNMSSPLHPQNDGQTERAIRSITQLLRDQVLQILQVVQTLQVLQILQVSQVFQCYEHLTLNADQRNPIATAACQRPHSHNS